MCSDGTIQFGSFQNNRLLPETAAAASPSKTGAPSGVPGAEAAVQQRETDAVSTQFAINIGDVLCAYPVVPCKTSFTQQTADIQRLILRYNTAIRALLKKYTSMSGTYRSILHNSKYKKDVTHPSLRPPADWSSLQLLFFTKRAIHDKFFGISMQQLLQFARECDLIGPVMTSYDVCMCVKAMHVEHRYIAGKKCSGKYITTCVFVT